MIFWLSDQCNNVGQKRTKKFNDIPRPGKSCKLSSSKKGGMIKPSHLDCPFSIHSLPSSTFNSQSSFLHPPTPNLLYKNSVLLLPIIFPNPQSKIQNIWLKMSSK